VSWINDTSAFVSMQRKENVEDAKRGFATSKHSNKFVVRTYDDYTTTSSSGTRTKWCRDTGIVGQTKSAANTSEATSHNSNSNNSIQGDDISTPVSSTVAAGPVLKRPRLELSKEDSEGDSAQKMFEEMEDW